MTCTVQERLFNKQRTPMNMAPYLGRTSLLKQNTPGSSAAGNSALHPQRSPLHCYPPHQQPVPTPKQVCTSLRQPQPGIQRDHKPLTNMQLRTPMRQRQAKGMKFSCALNVQATDALDARLNPRLRCPPGFDAARHAVAAPRYRPGCGGGPARRRAPPEMLWRGHDSNSHHRGERRRCGILKSRAQFG